MAVYDPDRRRFLLATIVTLIALPALWLVNRSDDSGAPNVASVGVAVDDSGSTAPTEGAPDEPADREPVFLDGPSSAPGGIAEIAVPAPPLRDPVIGSGTYSSIIISVNKCFVKDVTTGTQLTIVNLDNGRSVRCVATIAPSTQREDVLLHTRAYTQLADLTDAPIPVEIRR